MIRNNKGELVCECTSCGSEEYGGTLEFKAFVQSLKDLGWKIAKEEDEWCHYCPDCH